MNGSVRRRALLIGVELHGDGFFERLPSTRADCAELAAVLRERTIGGFDVDVVTNPSAVELRERIHRFCADCGPDELAVVYVSGHGVRGADGEFAFVATDTDHERLPETGVSAGFVNACLENCWSRQRVAIFDTCRSGAFSAGFRTRPPNVRKGTAHRTVTPRAAPVRPRGVYVLASSDVDQDSFSGPGTTVDSPTPSVFTAEVVDVLRTGAAGSSAGGLVTVDDLYDAVYQRMIHRDPPQIPLKSAHHVSGGIGIAAHPLGRAPSDVPGTTRASAAPSADDDSGTAPDWPTLIRYYAETVR